MNVAIRASRANALAVVAGFWLSVSALGCTADIPSQTGGGSSNAGASGAGGTSALSCSSVAPRLYRLSARQFANAVRDILSLNEALPVGDDTEAALSFYPRADAPVQAGLAAGFSAAVSTGLLRADVVARAGCAAAEDPTACAHAFIDAFASRVFRRPLEEADRDVLYALPTSPYAVGAARGVDNGIRLAIEAALNAPSFVYRRELAATPEQRLDSFETATQLAFMLSDSAPDDELWQAAIEGRLTSNEQVAAELDRLLAKPEVKATVTRVVGAWFGTDKVLSASKDPGFFPGFNDQNLQVALAESARLFVEEALWTGTGSIGTLLTSPRVHLNGPLAEIYGLTFDGSSPSEFVAYDVPAERLGIITHPAIMAGFSSSLETSVVKRGLFVVRKALCLADPPSPPPSVLDEVAEQLEDETTTERQKAEFRTMNICNGCHAMFDPQGLVLESYDAIGRFRTTDKNGAPLDASTEMSESVVLPESEHALDADDVQPIANALEFVSGVARTRQFALCGNRQILSYTVGGDVDVSCVEGEVSLEMTIVDVIKKALLHDLARKRVTGGS